MSHECPDCYLLCHCGGDIDDCLLNRDDDVNRCSHCEDKDGEPDWYFRDGYEYDDELLRN